MSQHDFTIANQTASNARTDINNAFQALASCSSGTTAPSTTFANMLWYDTSANILKMRNEANSAWLNILYIDQSSGSEILDNSQVVNTSGTQTGLIGGQSQSTWNTGTGTIESLISPDVLDAKIADKTSSSVSIPTTGMTQFPVGSYTVIYDTNADGALSDLFATITASTRNIKVHDTSSGNYTLNTIDYGTWIYMARFYGEYFHLVCRVS